MKSFVKLSWFCPSKGEQCKTIGSQIKETTQHYRDNHHPRDIQYHPIWRKSSPQNIRNQNSQPTCQTELKCRSIYLLCFFGPRSDHWFACWECQLKSSWFRWGFVVFIDADAFKGCIDFPSKNDKSPARECIQLPKCCRSFCPGSLHSDLENCQGTQLENEIIYYL